MLQFSENTRRHACDTAAFSRARTENVRRVHRMAPGYAPTALRALPELARRLGARAVYVKDESSRFGLNAFKGLGGFYAMFRMLCGELGLDPGTATLEALREAAGRDGLRAFHFATTTDGNHGRGVARAAGVFGCRAHVFLPRGSAEVRARAIRAAGAEATITGMDYDDCVAWVGGIAGERGWRLIQDTAWPGYEEVPLWIMQGYTTLFYEALDQMDARPTHLLLQAGVGAMAGAVAGAALESCGAPVIATVEPETVACFRESFRAGDGLPHRATGSGETIMAGLNCAVPCTLAWDILGGCAVGGFACPDGIAERGMRLLGGLEPPVISGESGAVTAGLLDALTEADGRELREALRLDERAVVLLVSTEGDTDPERYRRVLRGE